MSDINHARTVAAVKRNDGISMLRDGLSIEQAIGEVLAAADAVATPVVYRVDCPDCTDGVCPDCVGTGVVSCQSYPCEHGGHDCPCMSGKHRACRGWGWVLQPADGWRIETIEPEGPGMASTYRLARVRADDE